MNCCRNKKTQNGFWPSQDYLQLQRRLFKGILAFGGKIADYY